jgi:flavodoxin I
MKVLIVYDSFFGNTEQIARTMATTLQARIDTCALRVADVKPEMLAGLEILLVGSPTRGFRASDSIRAFLAAIPKDGLKGLKTAAFDTRIDPKTIGSPLFRRVVEFFGYAAEKIARQLTKLGGVMSLPPEGFIVKGSEGPLAEGELERAANWAKKLLPG